MTGNDKRSFSRNLEGIARSLSHALVGRALRARRFTVFRRGQSPRPTGFLQLSHL